ncbi:lanthionine synthetase c-like protein [Streptomyces xiamenensis]|uniref:Lanthionine synthetase c-like protein n=1 Tax=Streptomyces xiamenensis TaxID=408015 RepID=A0A0F7FXC0_9ACTN|nr:lanthionine synthetase C family protein [Streptomyces xiamenensis]AKG45060.1 lanthionine synthetase c-like protein [Streptomyces xiamenensis]
MNPTPTRADPHTGAAGITAEVVRRLREPGRILDHFTASPDTALWTPQTRHTLGRGLAGTALFLDHTEAGGQDTGAAAHAHLTAVARWLGRIPALNAGLHTGLAGIGLAAHGRAARTGGYTTFLDRLDRALTAMAASQHEAAAAPLSTLAGHDIIVGLTGTGRYALLRGAPLRPVLESVLAALVRLTEPVATEGGSVPGYWSLSRPRGEPVTRAREGHLNLGLSHGIAGPLALLSLALEAGVRVPGQREAIERIARVYVERHRADPYGLHWPNLLTWDDWHHAGAGAGRGRVAWCYGGLGIACALRLAARATGRADLAELAAQAVAAMIRVPAGEWGITDASLCHGWAGALNCLKFFATGEHATAVARTREHLAERIVRHFEPGSAFGYRYPEQGSGRPIDAPGFLDGAAGVALALDAHTRGDTAPAAWDAALLLA